jgi:hypothetical protein
MTKIILESGQIIDVVTIGYNQYFTLIDNQDFEIAKIIYNGDNVVENFEINRYVVDSTIIAVINQVDVLTDENANFYECITLATIFTENGFTCLRNAQ